MQLTCMQMAITRWHTFWSQPLALLCSDETLQLNVVSVLWGEEGGRQEPPQCFFFHMPESNYPPFCGASSEITDLTVTKYCHPGKPFCNQQGGFFLPSSHWKGPLFSGWAPAGCYQQWPARWAAATRPSAIGIGTCDPKTIPSGPLHGQLWVLSLSRGTKGTSPAYVFFLFPSWNEQPHSQGSLGTLRRW